MKGDFQMICSKCGTNVDERAAFCPVCGNKLEPAAAQPVYQPPQAPVPPYPFDSQPRGPYRAPISRRSIGVAILLTIVTCGIYGLYWLYCIVTDLNASVGDTDDLSGGMVILLSIVTCNIYLVYWNYKAGDKVNRLHEIVGKRQDSSLPILYLVLTLFGLNIVNMALIQSELNDVADA